MRVPRPAARTMAERGETVMVQILSVRPDCRVRRPVSSDSRRPRAVLPPVRPTPLPAAATSAARTRGIAAGHRAGQASPTGRPPEDAVAPRKRRTQHETPPDRVRAALPDTEQGPDHAKPVECPAAHP